MLNKILKLSHNKLISRKQTISVAESCTGGTVCSLLTKYPGASAYFVLGVVVYSNKAKEKILGIPKKTIAKYGAVSDKVAILMARNIRKKINTDFGISVTGIAGPAGATFAKPVGTVFIALSAKNKTLCRSFLFRGSRKSIRKHSALEAIRLLCAHLSR
jgi:nicotinamide-nucleotide amidase